MLFESATNFTTNCFFKKQTREKKLKKFFKTLDSIKKIHLY